MSPLAGAACSRQQPVLPGQRWKVAPMLAPNSRPPEFRLPDSRGQETALADFLGRRIVLVFSPDRAGLDALTASASGLNERDIVVVVILPPGHPLSSAPASPPVWILTDGGGRVRLSYGVPADGPFFCLIGKDGTIKRSGPAIPTPEELFEAVDAMPMRRQEMREEGRQGRG